MPIPLGEAVRAVLAQADGPLSPSQIKDKVKAAYPHLHGTEAARLGIERGNYQNLDHALLNPIYALVTRSPDFVVDRSQRPMRVALAPAEMEEALPGENYEADLGLVYVLATGLYTERKEAIVKIGHTTQPLDSRIAQLYTTGTPFRFTELRSWRVRNYVELEQALHQLLAPFRISRSREFFTEAVLPFVDAIVQTHVVIQSGETWPSAQPLRSCNATAPASGPSV
ncbi:MAG: GIY-YIG nuclease family protein [Lysobacteraceae bacterium]